MLSVPEATEKILSNTPVSSAITHPVNESLVGYILAEDVQAPESVPAFRASIVDGYAVICTSLLTSILY
jgi:gephyrin